MRNNFSYSGGSRRNFINASFGGYNKPKVKSLSPEEILKTPEEVEECKKTLNEDQLKVFNRLLEAIQNPDDKEYFVVIGYAGTGKTYALSKFIQATKCKVAMTAPTNKAVKVLMDMKGILDERVEYSTIHKLLNLRLKYVYPKPGQNFKPYQTLVSNFRGNVKLDLYDLLIVDEASMLDDELFMMIKEHKPRHMKVIFMGDPAQIPPVNKDDSIPLVRKLRDDFGIEDLYLEKIMRQSGDNRILETAYQIRNNRHQGGDSILSRQTNKDVMFFSSGSGEDIKKFGDLMLKLFDSDSFREDPNYCKCIAWTNIAVDAFNLMIRRHLFKTETPAPIMVGEKLIADTPIFDETGVIIFNTSDEFEVVEFSEAVFNYEMPSGKDKGAVDQLAWESLLSESKTEPGTKGSGRLIVLKYYNAQVKFKPIGCTEYSRMKVNILHPDSIKPLGWIYSGLIKMRMFPEYELMQQKFAQTKYNYAITAHKSQGSTYSYVFLIEDDINKNPKNLERNRIKYTACTRPKKKLFILSSRNKPMKEQ
jgi:exodeoxyribonuclease-5